EFHVDWTNESCEFHIDEVWPGPLMFPDPYGVPFFYAEEKITNITACDWFVIEDPIQAIPEPCSWWEVLDPAGDPTGLEFHIDISPGDGTFHVDQVSPDPLSIPWVPPTITITVRKKIDIIQPCDWFKVADPPAFLEPCSWWKIINPDVGDVEFHVDQVMPDGSFHIDDVIGDATMLPIHEVTAERKIDDIQPCDWFVVVNPPGFVPEPCSLWEIVWPSAWAGIVFHVDSNDGISSFHIDDTDASLPPPQLPPWNVTATPYEEPPPPWFKKPPYPDYAPSGMPDFDQKQDLWGPGVGIYTWCGPVSVANSLWWFDSKYDPSNIVPAFGPWDDHDPKNVDPLVQNLAFLMDTDGIRTHLMHMGTNFIDMETGISQYLQWQGINPMGDADGDGDVDDDDLLIIANAMQSTPGAPNWDMRADIVIDNVVDINDQNVAIANYGLVGAFYEHTEEYPDFLWIEDEIYRCEDVVLFLEFWQETGPGEWMPLYDNPSFEAGHYVTCAGVNSTTLELLISDPYWDATEAGFPGDIPVSHPYPHTTDIHNDTQYVSHDAYPVALRMDPPPLPYPVPMVWELVNYLQQLGYDPSWHAFIRAAIVTSPLAEPDIAVTNLTLCHGQTVCARNTSTWTHHINVTVTNEGTTAETFTLTVYWNTTNVISSTSVSLAFSETKIVEFPWNTTGYQLYANYTLSAYATPLPDETDQLDNTYIGPTVVVSFKGDVDADGDIDIYDVVKITGVYMSKLGDPNYKPNSDIDCNGVIDIYDVVKCTGNYNWKYTPSP
ncbi:MAG: hypothetical protein OEX01_06695, partial [Candidatus Bathyarchaeota archaeon]|nr:hypothetical protein [Candidatus Bathyarchaeota archaeon]